MSATRFFKRSFVGGLALASAAAMATGAKEAPVFTSDLAVSASVECTEALAKRTVAVSAAGYELAALSGASESDILEMESQVMNAHREIASAVGAATGGAVFKAAGLPSLDKTDIEALLGLCKGMKRELSGEGGLAERLLQEAREGTFKVHLPPNATLAKQTLTLEQYVLIKAGKDYPAHSKFEPVLSTMMPVDKLEAMLDNQVKLLTPPQPGARADSKTPQRLNGR